VCKILSAYNHFLYFSGPLYCFPFSIVKTLTAPGVAIIPLVGLQVCKSVRVVIINNRYARIRVIKRIPLPILNLRTLVLAMNQCADRVYRACRTSTKSWVYSTVNGILIDDFIALFGLPEETRRTSVGN
jgi:hypothetical protein